MKAELEKKLLWAVTNIPPWDKFWESVPSSYISELLYTSHNTVFRKNKGKPGTKFEYQQTVFIEGSDEFHNMDVLQNIKDKIANDK